MIGAFSSAVRGEQRQCGEQDVARHHVGEKSDCQRERPHQEQLHELDRRHEDVERLRHARREEVAGEVLELVVLEPDEQVDHVVMQREEAGQPKRAVGGNWMNGMTSQKFRNRMKRNSEPRNGV